MFKSFNPPKYSTKKNNNHYSSLKSMRELCSECGYPYGMHYDDDCPTDKNFLLFSADNRATIIPYHAPVKLTEREKNIRMFRKFLYDNDALEAWYKNRKQYFKRRRSIFSGLNKERYIIGAFDWNNTEEGTKYWIELDMKWEKMLKAQ